MSETSEAARCAAYMKALGDPMRMRILECLRAGPQSVSDIALLLEIEIANASHHLRLMNQAGLTTTRREGKFIYYSLNPEIFSRKGSGRRDVLDFGCCRVVLGERPDDEPAPPDEA